MADASGMQKGSQGKETFNRFPLRRIDPVLRKFFKIFQVNLDRMQQHKLNMQNVCWLACMFSLLVNL